MTSIQQTSTKEVISANPGTVYFIVIAAICVAINVGTIGDFGEGWSMLFVLGSYVLFSAPSIVQSAYPIPLSMFLLTFSTISATDVTCNETAILHASDKGGYDLFGRSVSISGNYIVVGAYYEDGGAGSPLIWAGAAYVYQLINGVWNEDAILHASDKQAKDHFGKSVSISGNYIVVGAFGEDGGAGSPTSSSGAAYVYELSNGIWNEMTILHASDKEVGDLFGNSVSISGNYIVVGAFGEDGGVGSPLNYAGAAYVYELSNGIWNEMTILHASDKEVGDLFGYSVSISGDYIVVGAIFEDGGAGSPLNYAGAAYVYQLINGVWNEDAILHASDKEVGDRFCNSVSISGNYIVVGAQYEDGGVGSPLNYAGAAYVYELSNGVWNEMTILHASDKEVLDLFGNSVSISGNYIVVGAVFENGGAGSPSWAMQGAAYVYELNNGIWNEMAILHASDKEIADHFGNSVSISGNYIVVGAPYEDGGVGSSYALNAAGAAYVYELTPIYETCTDLIEVDWDALQVSNISQANISSVWSASTLEFSIEIGLDYVTRSKYTFEDQYDTDRGITYVIDTEPFLRDGRLLSNANNCENRESVSFDGKDWKNDYWSYLDAANGLNSINYLEYGPSNIWTLNWDTNKVCERVKYSNSFSFRDLLGCTNKNGGNTFTFIEDSNWLNLTGTFYVTLVSPLRNQNNPSSPTDSGQYLTNPIGNYPISISFPKKMASFRDP